jgi:hypothetical protein
MAEAAVVTELSPAAHASDSAETTPETSRIATLSVVRSTCFHKWSSFAPSVLRASAKSTQ